jgi:hypothetical protein
LSVVTYYEKPGTNSVDSKGVRTYVRKFLFIQSNFTDYAPITWGGSGPSISRYDVHPTDSGARAISLTSNPTESLGQYEVDITYSSEPFDSGNPTNDPTQSDQSVTPTSRPWQISFDSVHTERLLGPKDLANKAVTNSANQPFDPPPTVPCSNLKVTIVAYFVPSWNAAAHVLTYQDSINNAIFNLVINPTNTLSFPAKTVRCTEYNVKGVNESGTAFWEATVVLEYRVKAWNPIQVLDAGTCYIKSMSLPPQPILDATGNPVSTSVCLDGSGHVLSSSGTPQYISFTGYNEVNMATMLS